MRKRYLFVLIFAGACTALSAQQAIQYSMYQLNPYAFNPALAGTDNTLVATGVYRQQWSGLKGAPLSQHVNAHLPLNMIRSGVGVRFDNDLVGAHRTTRAMLSFSRRLELSNSAVLSLGAGAGYLQYSLDGDKLRTPEGTYSMLDPFSHQDQLLPEGKVQAGAPVFELGLWFRSERLEFGASIQPLFAPVLSASGDGRFRLEPERQYFFTGNYTWQAGENLLVKPGFLVKSDITETQMELTVVMNWRENIFVGASYRGLTATSRDAVILMGGFKLNEKTFLGYSFDISLSALGDVNRGSHELLLRYRLNKPIGEGKLPPVIYNPRFL